MNRENQTSWGKGVRIVMISRNMSVNELAEIIGTSAGNVSSAISGSYRSEKMRRRISDALAMEPEELEAVAAETDARFGKKAVS